MKKMKSFGVLLLAVLIFAVNILPVSAMTTQVVITPSYEEDSALSVNFKNNLPSINYVYTGEIIKPELIIKKMDGSVPDESEYKVEYLTDCTSVGRHDLRVTYLKNNYSVELFFDIVPGKTDKVDVKTENGVVTISWNAVPGAGVYRVYKYNEETGRYTEMWWPDGEIASASTSRTFTSEELEPGKTYKMGIMALPSIEWMPTDQITYFTVDTAKDTDASTTKKPVTTEEATEKQTQKTEKTTLITPQPTKAGVTSEGVVSTTVKEEVGTTASETTTIREESTTEENIGTADTISDAKADSDNVSEEKEPVDRTKLIIIIVVCVLAIAGIVFTVYKKKK